jgi:hypothetical protein
VPVVVDGVLALDAALEDAVGVAGGDVRRFAMAVERCSEETGRA